MAAQAHAGAEQGVHQGGHPGTAGAPPAFRSLGVAEEQAAEAAAFRSLGGADEPTMATMATTMISDEEIARALQVEMEQEGHPYP